MNPGRTRKLAWIGALAVLATPIVAWAAPYLEPTVAAGTTLDGLDLGGALPGEAHGAARILAESWLDTPVTVLAAGVAHHATRRELGARVSFDTAVERAVSRGRSGSPLVDVLERGPVALESVRTFDTEVGLEALERIRERVDVAPLAARTDETGRAVPARGGRALRPLVALAELERALLASEPVIELPVQELAPPTVPPLALESAIYTRTVATFSTRYSLSEEQWGRAVNIATAAAAIDGAVIPPFEELSFNEVVGPRTIERGYRAAEELDGGRIVEGIGGGICQVAATLHAAVFLGGLEIVEHHPHTRTSRYIDLGLDAAVSWPSVDLRVRNPYAFPIRIRASTARGTVTVALLGAAVGPNVRWSTRIERVLPRGVERQPLEGAVAGTRQVLDDGVDGLVVRRERVYRVGRQRVRDVTRLTYRPVARLVGVAP